MLIMSHLYNEAQDLVKAEPESLWMSCHNTLSKAFFEKKVHFLQHNRTDVLWKRLKNFDPSVTVFSPHCVLLLFVLLQLSALYPSALLTHLALLHSSPQGALNCFKRKWVSEMWWGLMCLISAHGVVWPCASLFWKRANHSCCGKRRPWQRFNLDNVGCEGL